MDEAMIMTLTDENGNQVDYELMDIVPFENNTYAVFYPTKEGETEVIICRVEELPDKENDKYIMETDPRILNAVYKQFKIKYMGKIYFADGK